MNRPIGMSSNRVVRPLAVGAMLAAVTLSAAVADERALDVVRSDYETGHYQRAFDRVAVLADGGHCEAARLAREMVRHGPRLYGLRFGVAPERLTRWQAVPRCEATPALAAVAAP